MTKEEKKKLYQPKRWNLFENDNFIDSFPSHSAAKKAKHFKIKEAYDDFLDITYTIKPQL